MLSNSNLGLDTSFYSIYLVCYLASGDLHNAKYLWKRAPEGFKSVGTLPQVWEVGKALWKDDAGMAMKIILEGSWPTEVRAVVSILRDSIVRRHLATMTSAYAQVTVASLANQLHISQQQLLECKQEHCWFTEKLLERDHLWFLFLNRRCKERVLRGRHQRHDYSRDLRVGHPERCRSRCDAS